MKRPHIAFIGAGNMAEAVIQGVLASGLFRADQIVASDPSPARRAHLAERYGVRAVEQNREAAEWGDFIVLGVKPRSVDAVLVEVRPELKGKVLISVAAGVPLSRLSSGVERGVIRAMPNAPARVRAGATALVPARGMADDDLAAARKIFESIGAVWIVDEKEIDAVTGLSGSGPAYIALVIEAMADGGVKCGLTREVALALAAQTAFGTAKMLIESGHHPARLKDEVASPAGTTIAGLHCLEQGGVRAALISAVEAATARAVALGGGAPSSSLPVHGEG